MNILLTLHHPLVRDSGAAGSTFALAEHYRKSGHDVTIYSWDSLPSKWSISKKNVLFPYFSTYEIERQLRHSKFDIIDSHTGDAWLWGTVFRPITGHKVALVTRSTGLEHTDHEQRIAAWKAGQLQLRKRYFIYHGGLRLWEVQRSLKAADICIMLNEMDRRYAADKLAIPADKLRVCGNGIPDFLLKLPPPENLLKPRAASIGIAVVGSFIEKKGIDYSIPALHRLLEQHTGIHVGFFGTGAARGEILERFPEAIRDRIEVVPKFRQTELPELLRGYSIQLLASITEGFGKVLVEGMAAGLAVVTTDTPGPLEFARDGENALVVPRRDTDAIYSAVEALVLDADLRLTLATAGWNAAKSYGWHSIAERRLEFYAEAVAIAKRRGS